MASSLLTIAAAAAYEHRLEHLGAHFAGLGLAPVIVKGQAIVDLAYPPGEARVTGDVDLLVGDDEVMVSAALRRLGYAEQTDPSRRVSAPLLGERAFVTRNVALPSLVEVHRFLDKGILRPVDYAGILARARQSPRPGFRYPAIEDLLLLVVLHESVAQVPSLARTGRDVRMILDHGKPDMRTVRARARLWELDRALDMVLAGRSEGAPEDSSALAYFWAQRRHHDSSLTWALGLARYGAARVADRWRR